MKTLPSTLLYFHITEGVVNGRVVDPSIAWFMVDISCLHSKM